MASNNNNGNANVNTIFPSVVDLFLFHTTERNLYARLTRRLGFESEKMKMTMAFWLWFESIGHHDFVRHVYSYDDEIVKKFVSEAEACLDCLLLGASGDVGPGGGDDIPLTSWLINEPMDRRFFEYHRELAVRGITRIYFNVCRIIFDDGVMLRVARDTDHPDNKKVMSSGLIFWPFGEGTSQQGAALGAACMLGEAAISPSAVTEAKGEEVTDMVDVQQSVPVVVDVPPPPPVAAAAAEEMLQSSLNPMAKPWVPGPGQSSEDERSMFITFSKGHPISREDISEFFNSRFGQCVEVVMIDRAPPGVLPMYGRIIFTSVSMIAIVLNGQRTAKFMIKGKHLWARMYEPRRN